MRPRFWRIPFLLVCLACFVAGQETNKRDVFFDCDKSAKTQTELNDCAIREDTGANDEMNSTYRELLNRAASDPVAVKKIEASQQAWIAFREAQIAALYPAEDKMEYGSAFTICIKLLRADLTKQRTKMLKQMLKKPVEGDVCATGYPERSR